ncbi:MAG: Asp23/Gls24 family envelope stress response protein [Lachnospiraceae bacterium]|nr:Asp23/Gls24 family envelope stress response protein [Lachnospiraceae bacterium]
MGNSSIDTHLGRIDVDESVVARCAAAVADECFGVVGMAAVGMKDGIVKLLGGRDSTRGIRVVMKDSRISVDLHIIVSYGVSIMTVAANLQESVKYRLEQFTGLTTERVDVYVEGVRVID